MKQRRSMQLAAALLSLPVFGVSVAADLAGYLVLTTDYVHRGVTQSDGDPAGQIGLDLSFDSGLYGGVWGSTIDISNGPNRQRDLQVNYYLGYGFDPSSRWRFAASVVAYTYPGANSDVDYDYVEYSISGNYDDRFWIEYAYSPDIYDTGLGTHNVEAYAEWPFATDWAAGGGVGYYDVSSLAGRSYGYWQIGVSRVISRFEFDLRYHDTNRWVPIFSTQDRADSRIALSITLPF